MIQGLALVVLGFALGCDAHIAAHPGIVEGLAAKWGVEP